MTGRKQTNQQRTYMSSPSCTGTPGARFLKGPKTFRPQNAICKKLNTRSTKLLFWHGFQIRNVLLTDITVLGIETSLLARYCVNYGA